VNKDKNTAQLFPTYLVAEATDGSPIKLTIFGIQKLLNSAVGLIKSAKKLRSGSVLIEVSNQSQADRALKMTTWIDQPIKVTPHRSLNSSRGVIRCPQFKECDDEEVLYELKPQGVTSLKRFQIKKNGKMIPTGTFILNFNTPTPPKRVTAAYMSIAVEPFVPGPLRCYNCQKYGHGKSTCNHGAVCARCGKEGHQDTNCDEQPHCVNCSGSHAAYSKECPEWSKQQKIVQIKHERNVTFKEAKMLVEQQISKPTYASVASTSSKQPSTMHKSVSTISTQTDITWPKDSKVPINLTVSSMHTQTNTDESTPEDDTHLGAVGGDSSAKSTSLSNIPHCLSSTPKPKVQTNIQKPGPASSKSGLGNKPPKGSKDPISLFNRFGSLDSMDVELSPGKGPGGRKKS
jgi:hypothetical protein